MPSREIGVIVGALEDFIEAVVRKLVLDVNANLVATTPVDTGWARANWIPRIGTPREDTAGSPDSISRGEQEQGVAEVATSYQIEMGPVYITNNVPYIGRLNQGSSQQAPAGFVQAAITKGIRQLQGERRR